MHEYRRRSIQCCNLHLYRLRLGRDVDGDRDSEERSGDDGWRISLLPDAKFLDGRGNIVFIAEYIQNQESF